MYTKIDRHIDINIYVYANIYIYIYIYIYICIACQRRRTKEGSRCAGVWGASCIER